jgi:hypothetical protein
MDPRIELGSYSVESGLQLTWQADYRLRILSGDREVLLSGNAAGLRSLAQHLLTWLKSTSHPGFTPTWSRAWNSKTTRPP